MKDWVMALDVVKSAIFKLVTTTKFLIYNPYQNCTVFFNPNI